MKLMDYLIAILTLTLPTIIAFSLNDPMTTADDGLVLNVLWSIQIPSFALLWVYIIRSKPDPRKEGG